MSVIKVKIQNEDTKTILYVNIFGAYHEFCKYENLIEKTVYVGRIVTYKNLDGFELLSMSNPYLFTDKKEDLKIYPVYRKYKGISEDFYEKAIQTSYMQAKEDYLPHNLISRFKLYDYKNAIRAAHFPKSEEDIKRSNQRMVFDDMLYFASKVENANTASKLSDIKPDKYSKTSDFIKSLPFTLTEDQLNAVKTLKEKMGLQQTTALIQGDVSCGKTIVAEILMFLMAENSYQSVLMAPTVILAKQHYEEILKYATPLGYSVAYLSSDLTTSQKKTLINEINEGKHLLIVGTHCVFSKDICYKNLGLIITDEEHKFGVMQRESIRNKADNGVHMITMSATPIPRTLAVSIYGNDIEVITIKQMPNGRKKVKTAISYTDSSIFKHAKTLLDLGQQIYVVCPLIDEAEEESVMQGISSVEKVKEKYKKAFEPLGYKVESITGKTSSEEAATIKDAFYKNKIQILVATTVIEVGVNVPNATLIVIESAERFGLATLHQLRGRVGRGSLQSYCVLKKTSENVCSKNLEILLHDTDGFEIAKADFKNRGPGNILGKEQSGYNKFISLIIEYPELYKRVIDIAKTLSKEDRAKYIEKFEEYYPSIS